MTDAQLFLVPAIVTAVAVAYLVRDYLPAFLVSGALAWSYGMVQSFLGNTGCYYSPSYRINDPIAMAIHAAPLAIAVGLVALLFAYAFALHRKHGRA